MEAEPKRKRRFQFGLRTLLLVVTAFAVGMRAYLSGSKLWFLIMLAGACAGIGMCTYRAVKRREQRWAFATSAAVGLIGLVVTFSQEMPFTGSNIIKVMWTLSPLLELTYSAYIGIVYLIATFVIAALSGLIVAASTRFFQRPASGPWWV
jgi:ABC-type microcin C transport system permease subunit YejB